MTSNAADDPQIKASSAYQSADSVPACCDSGCTVCVLDYPEFFPKPTELPTTEEEAVPVMLQAVVRAQLLLESLDSETIVIQPEIEGGQ